MSMFLRSFRCRWKGNIFYLLLFWNWFLYWGCLAYLPVQMNRRTDFQRLSLPNTKYLISQVNLYRNLSTRLCSSIAASHNVETTTEFNATYSEVPGLTGVPASPIYHWRAIQAFWKAFRTDVGRQWRSSVRDFRSNPVQYLSIPVVAALVGYVTNYIGVWMLFYPIQWKGIPLKRWPEQPLGLVGWQGVVPAKRFVMSKKMVDVTINKLLSIKEVFQQLDITILSSLFTKMIQPKLFSGILPVSITNVYMKKIVKDIVDNVENIIDLRQLVITKMTTDPKILGSFFQRVGKNELDFLISSGTYFGFLLGVVQMFQWMIYPKPWTLPVGGAVVGYVTNWIALKWIFEPLNPQRFGPFILQGLFLKRQREVTNEFVNYMTTNVLYSKELWRSILLAPKNYKKFLYYIQSNLPSLVFPKETIELIGTIIKDNLLSKEGNSRFIGTRIHRYIDNTLQLKTLLTKRMNALSPKEFEQVLHPIFQEDELTLIIAGGVLGMLAGYGQMLLNDYLELRRKKKFNNENKKNKKS